MFLSECSNLSRGGLFCYIRIRKSYKKATPYNIRLYKISNSETYCDRNAFSESISRTTRQGVKINF